MDRNGRWRQAVFRRGYGRCPHCGGYPSGGAHHIVARGYQITKFVVENGIPTCFIFHRMWENPKIKEYLVDKYVGIEKYILLQSVAEGRVTIEEAGFTLIT